MGAHKSEGMCECVRATCENTGMRKSTHESTHTLTLVFSDSVTTMGRMAVERHGDWVRSLEMFNVVSLVLLNKRCTSADDRRLSCWGRVGLWEVSCKRP